MPAAARLGDKAQVDQDAHGCPACPHPGVGPIVAASTDVLVNDGTLDDLRKKTEALYRSWLAEG